MSKKLFVFFIRAFFSRINKRGFTLAEALIITVMTGACLLPILGTMQNAQVRTEKYDHYSKMQQYARSRLNAEIANAAFDHKSINLEDEYHYIAYFASGTAGNEGSVDDAKLIEFPRSDATLEDLASITEDDNHDNWATSAVNLLGIKRADKKPYLEIVHAYKTSVESKNNPALAEFGNESNIIDTPKALLGIVVKNSLVKSNGSFYNPADGALVTEFDTDGSIKTTDKESVVSPVSLFSFVNLPTVSDEYIWMVASNSSVIGFDPVSKNIANTIPFGKEDFEPRHIAVHPTGKMLAVQCRNYIYLVNTDSKSLKKNDKKQLFYAGAGKDYRYCEGPEEGGGIAFRTDGKVLYFTDMKNKKLYMYELNYSFFDNADKEIKWNDSTPSLTGKNAYIDFANYGDRFSNIVSANDGYLYVACAKHVNEVVSGEAANEVKVVYKFPMYSSFNGLTIPIVESDKEIRKIDVSSDGRFLLCVPKGKPADTNQSVKIYETNTGKLLQTKTIQTNKGVSEGIFVSFSGKESNFKDNSLFIALALPGKAKEQSSISIYNFSDTSTPWAELTLSDLKEMGPIIESPIDGKLVFSADLGPGKGNKEKLLFFANYIFKQANYALSDDEEAVGFGKKKALDVKIADLAAKKRDILAVAEGDATRTIQLYDLNTLKILEDNAYTATYSITGLAMNSQGNMLLSNHDGLNKNIYQYNILDGSIKKANTGSYTQKVVFDGASPDMAFALQNTRNSSGSKTSEYFYNLYSDILGGRWETSSTDNNDRRNYPLDSGWTNYDIIGMPNGGAMALYGKSDGSSMLEWIGRRDWGYDSSNIGKYKLFARWAYIKNSSSGGSKIVPGFPLETSSLSGWELDNWKGRVEIIRDTELPVNGKVISLNYKLIGWSTGWWSSGDENRSITPLLLEKQSSGNFVVKDYGNSFTFNKNDRNSNLVTAVITWHDDGEIKNSNYRLGFWNGNIDSGCTKGPIAFKSNNSNYSYVADYYSGTDYLLTGRINASDIKDSTNLIKPSPEYSGKKRNYALSFNIEVPIQYGFPPLYSKKLAISPDCGTLAILTYKTEEQAFPTLYIFDFNNYIYGPDTQVEGMLVDYRELYNSNVDNYDWPAETKGNIFKNVFTGCSIATFSDFLTKYDNILALNKYPANYKIYSVPSGSSWDDTQKKYANKRFLGYYRSENDISKMLLYYSEEPRVFFNNVYLYGAKGKSTGGPFAKLENMSVSKNKTGLFQIDQASDGNGMTLGIFFNSSNSAGLPASGSYDVDDSVYPSHYYIETNNWFNLLSDYTYILKNQPSFINSYKVYNQSDNHGINMDYANMVFSRDRANPVLYIKGQNKLFVLYKNYFKMFDPAGGENSIDVVISEDGQKLVYGKGQNIKVYNISNPTDDFFKNNESIDGDADKYLGVVGTINTSVKPFYLATKPFTSFNSLKVGGHYNCLAATDSFKIGANSVAIASGGIYISDEGYDKIFCYNPLTKAFKIKGNTKMNKNSSALTAYDDTLYMFGNAEVSGETLSGRVQSYDVNSNRAMSSKEVLGTDYNDEYQVNYGIVNADAVGNPPSNCPMIYTYIPGHSVFNQFHAFYNSIYFYSGNNNNGSSVASPAIDIKFTLPLTVNKIKYSNYCNDNAKGFGIKGGVDAFSFSGTNDENALNSSALPLSENWDTLYDSYSALADFLPQYGDSYDDASCLVTPISEGCYKCYRFNLLSAGTDTNEHDACSDSYRGTVSYIELWRTGVKRLTPAIGSLPTREENLSNISWDIPNTNNKSTMNWSTNSSYNLSPTNHTHLNDVYVSNSISSNVISGSDTWTSSISNPWIKISFTEPEAITVVRYSNNDLSKYLKKFKFYGWTSTTNSERVPVYNNSWENDWEELTFTDNTKEFVGPVISKSFITAELNNNKKYKKYLFVATELADSSSLVLNGFEVFASPVSEASLDDYLTPMLNDNLKEVTVSNSAACATPYGLVVSGGIEGTANATTTALLYWPHAINKYDGNYYQFGIPRSLPNFRCRRANHSLVWHKGKIYAIGGRINSLTNYVTNGTLSEGGGTAKNTAFIECLDFNSNMIWSDATVDTSTPSNGSFTFRLNQTIDELYRYNHGACSFGDEIFIFGGQKGSRSSDILNTAFAWNPETKAVRKLTVMDEALSPCCAVPYGSKIYIIGMNSSNELKIYEYTP